MPINLGTGSIGSIRLGTKQVTAVYVGTKQVFPATTPDPGPGPDPDPPVPGANTFSGNLLAPHTVSVNASGYGFIDWEYAEGSRLLLPTAMVEGGATAYLASMRLQSNATGFDLSIRFRAGNRGTTSSADMVSSWETGADAIVLALPSGSNLDLDGPANRTFWNIRTDSRGGNRYFSEGGTSSTGFSDTVSFMKAFRSASSDSRSKATITFAW